MRHVLISVIFIFGGAVALGADPGGPVRAKIETVDGHALAVEIQSIGSDRALRARSDGTEIKLPIDDIKRISPDAVAKEDTPFGNGRRMAMFFLADGGQVRAKIAASGNHPATVGIDIGLPEIAQARFAALAAVRLAEAELPDIEKDFRARIADRKPGRDTIVINQGGKATALQGSLEKLDADGWEFSFGSRTRKGGMNDVYGFVLGAGVEKAATAEATVRLRNGNRFGAKIETGDAGSVRLSTSAFDAISVPWSAIEAMDLQSDRVVDVASLTPDKVVQASLPGADWPVKQNRSVTGAPMRMSGKTYDAGLGVHAYNKLTYSLNGEFARFSAIVGIDDSVGAAGSVVFRVIGDGKQLFASPVMRGGIAPTAVSVDVAGVKMLELETTEADELDLSDHADWANAVLVRDKTQQSH